MVAPTKPVKRNVAQSAPSVRKCHEAGVGVHMLTGDHPETACAIAREVGILPRRMDDVAEDVAQQSSPQAAPRGPKDDGVLILGMDLVEHVPQKKPWPGSIWPSRTVHSLLIVSRPSNPLAVGHGLNGTM